MRHSGLLPRGCDPSGWRDFAVACRPIGDRFAWITIAPFRDLRACQQGFSPTREERCNSNYALCVLSASPARRGFLCLLVQAGALSSPSMKSSWAIVYTANHSEDGDLGGQVDLGFNFRGPDGCHWPPTTRQAVALPVQSEQNPAPSQKLVQSIHPRHGSRSPDRESQSQPGLKRRTAASAST